MSNPTTRDRYFDLFKGGARTGEDERLLSFIESELTLREKETLEKVAGSVKSLPAYMRVAGGDLPQEQEAVLKSDVLALLPPTSEDKDL